MIAKHLKYRFRKLYAAYVPAAEIKRILGIDGAIYRIAANEWPELKAKRSRHFSKVSKQENRKFKEEPVGQSYEDQQASLQIPGYERLRTPKHCKQCRKLSFLHRKDGKHCFACGMAVEATVKRVLAGVAMLLLMVCAGCQSAPREVRISAHVAGQELKVSVMR